MEKIESMSLDTDALHQGLLIKTGTRTYRTELANLTIVESHPQPDEFKKLMDEIGDNLTKMASKSHEIFKEKRKDVLKGLRDWIDKEIA
jgi:arsenate reductase-like glutaredoxin family protein